MYKAAGAHTLLRIRIWKILCGLAMLAVSLLYIPGLEWALSLNVGRSIVSYLPTAFVLTMCHELLHALSWWYYGHFAIPIPILIPPILGITIGDRPKNRWENLTISLAPILLTVTSLLAAQIMENEQYFLFGMINLFGMGYDLISAFARVRTR